MYFFQESTETKLSALQDERQLKLSQALRSCKDTVLNTTSKFIKSRHYTQGETVLYTNAHEYTFGKELHLYFLSRTKTVETEIHLNQQNACGYSLLHYACLYDLPSIVDVLLENGADVTLKDAWGNQPLHIAATHGSVDVIKSLINYGAGCYTKNINRMNPFDLAIAEERISAVLAMYPHQELT